MNAAADSMDDAHGAALAHPLEGPCLALTGPPGAGKSRTLAERARTLAARANGATILVTAPSSAGVARCARALGAVPANLDVRTLADVAFALLRDSANVAPARIDDATAAAWFVAACDSLFALEWPEIAAAQIDPEVTGLGSPERFAIATYRLIRKLRSASIGPSAFRTAGLRGATEFYAKPPNFATSALLEYTSATYRDSLRAGPAELERQRAREVDLVLIVARLYETYEAMLRERRAATDADAIDLALERARSQPAVRAAWRARYAAATVDDAQDLTRADLALLAVLLGDDLRGLTVAGDPEQATRGFATGARADVFARAVLTLAFPAPLERDRGLAYAARLGLDPLARAVTPPPGEAVVLYRAADRRDEARFIASEIVAALERGIAPHEIAIVTLNLDCAHDYANALLARDVPLDIAGAADLLAFPIVLDTLAACWAAIDPYRHDYLLRNLDAPWLGLCDATIATLCGEARDPQAALFELPDEDDDEARAHRWDRKRDLRLGRNVTRGDVDAELDDDARERLNAFRVARTRWEGFARTLGPAAMARAIAAESSLATLESGARGRFDAALVARLLERIEVVERRDPAATLEDVLRAFERGAEVEVEPEPLVLRDADAVRLLDVEAAKGESFERVFVPDLRAGAWPPYYTPDAFLFTPARGMIAKENAGDGAAARTAKFTYELFRSKFKEKYYDEQRRAFYCAATRARSRLFVSAPGRATRGTGAPELLAELERALTPAGP